jgi:hypothetical protein
MGDSDTARATRLAALHRELAGWWSNQADLKVMANPNKISL